VEYGDDKCNSWKQYIIFTVIWVPTYISVHLVFLS